MLSAVPSPRGILSHRNGIIMIRIRIEYVSYAGGTKRSCVVVAMIVTQFSESTFDFWLPLVNST